MSDRAVEGVFNRCSYGIWRGDSKSALINVLWKSHHTLIELSLSQVQYINDRGN